MPVTFVTGNEKKWAEVQAILGDQVIIERVVMDIPEIQGSIEDIAKFKCREAARAVNGSVITEDTALCMEALGGLPGPYIKWFVQSAGLEGITQMLAGFPADKRGAEAVCTFAYSSGPDAEPIIFQGRVAGQIVPPRGSRQFGWDPIFQPDHPSGYTFAEMPASMKNSISHRMRALQKLQQHFEAERVTTQ